MSVLTRTVISGIAVISGLAAGLLFAGPAAAEPGDNPCDLAISYFCKFVPIAPELEGDVDLTQQLPPADPNAPLPESLPPADPCAAGCI
jgi:hypothetical protein